MEENNRQQTRITRYRTMILAAVVLALTTLSLHGGLDNVAQEDVAETTKESMGLYVISRSINAGISTLQSSQIKVPFLASIQIGELLDPVNDAVERLSSAIVWAIGSLFLQRIVLEVAESSVFKWSFFAIGFIAISALLLASWERVRNPFCEVFAVSKANLDRYRDLLVRIFIVATIFRFIVPTFVVISSLVGQTFLETEINEHRKKLSAWEKNVSEIQKQIIDEQNAREQSLEEQKMLGPVLPDEMKAREQDPSLGNYLSSLFSWMSDAASQSISSIPSGIVEKTSDMVVGTTKLVVEKTSDMVTSMTKLVVAIVVENVILPIVFLMIAVKCSVPIAKYSVRLSSTLKQDSKELRDSLQQAN